jgi:hypothetical protein
MAIARVQAIICKILASARFGHMLNLARTRRLLCGGRIAHRTVDN